MTTEQQWIKSFIDREARRLGISQGQYLSLPADSKLTGKSPLDFILHLVLCSPLTEEGIQDLLGMLGWDQDLWEKLHGDLIRMAIEAIRL